MTIIGGFPFFSYFSSQSTRSRKSIQCVIKRQPFSSSPHRKIPKSTTYQQNQYYKQEQQKEGPEIITENSILNNFPRPNLMPTLHFSLFGYNTDPNNNKKATKCNNCSGPHSTDFCPC